MSDFINGGSDLTNLSDCDIYSLKNRFDYVKWHETMKLITSLYTLKKEKSLDERR